MPTIRNPRKQVTRGQRCCPMFRTWRTVTQPPLKPAISCVRWVEAVAEWEWEGAGEEWEVAEGKAEVKRQERHLEHRRRVDLEDREGFEPGLSDVYRSAG